MVRQSSSHEPALTFIKCLFTHFVKVFFCTRSRSSAKQRNHGQTSDSYEKEKSNKHLQTSCKPKKIGFWLIYSNADSCVSDEEMIRFILKQTKNVSLGGKTALDCARLHLSQTTSEHIHCWQMRPYRLGNMSARSCLTLWLWRCWQLCF